MSGVNDALRAFASRVGAGVLEVLSGVVSSIDESGLMISVSVDDAVEIPDVRLRAVSDDGKRGMVCIPKKGSDIVFAKVDGEADYVLLLASELDKVIVEIDSVKMEVTKEGYKISKGSDSLRSIFEDLKTLLTNFKVNTPSGPSAGVLPDTLSAINALEVKFKNLLK